MQKKYFSGETLQNFKQLASKSLDKHLSSNANQQLLTSAPTGSKSELILDHAREGALGLLKRWPGNKAKLHQFFNQALPDRLRQITWRLFLRSPKGNCQSAMLLACLILCLQSPGL